MATVGKEEGEELLSAVGPRHPHHGTPTVTRPRQVRTLISASGQPREETLLLLFPG